MSNIVQSNECKGCSASVQISEQRIQRILVSLQSKGFDCVTDETYQKRLAVCYDCSSLQYGSTCMHCGCIVQVRAKFKEKNCPYPGNSKWETY